MADNTAENLPESVTGLLIPMVGKPLLLPRLAVAEILPLPEVQYNEQTPSWHLGEVYWRNIEVPVVSMEALNGGQVLRVPGMTRMAVVTSIKESETLPFYAILVQGMPRVIEMASDEVVEDEDEPAAAEYQHVVATGERAIIPDLDYIEIHLIESLGLGEE